ncbi:cytochrome P450 [Micromonospora echinospora]|uniref:cytochrome P450 n=1 Tax=Micromonospora echinospora TaxID=1877 RepID=UPI003CEBF548
MTVSEASSISVLFDQEWSGKPYELYALLQAEHAIMWDDIMRSWIVLRHSQITELAKDARLSGARIDDFHRQLPPESRATMAPLAAILKDMMLFNEGPAHSRLRKLIRPNLSPRFIRDLRTMIEKLADALLDQVVPTGEMDVVRDFSEPLTRGVIAMIAGVPSHAAHLLENWPGLLHEFFSQSPDELPRLAALRAAFDETADLRQAGAGDDLFTQMIAEQLGRDSYTADEVFANFLLLIDAGQATTTHLIGNAALALLHHREQADLLRQRPEVAANAAHEFMRYDSSVQFTTRVALADIELDDVRIRQGDTVTLLLGAGNRDPRRYADPGRLDLTRKASDHLSFGHGIHYCLGASLALAEIEIAMQRLVRRTWNWRLAQSEINWLDSINFRFLTGLRIRFDH